MTQVLSLRFNRTIILLAFLAFLFALIYLIFVPRSFAQNASPSAKREAQRLKACQIHERNIKNRLDSLVRLVTNQEKKFDAIATRVENRYKTRLVPKGKTLSNFDALVAYITSKKTTVDAALGTTKSDVAGFSCSVADPKAQLTQFRKDMQAVKSSLKEYRKSVRNLIVAIETEKVSPTPSPKQ